MNWGDWPVQKFRAFWWWKDMIMWETWVEATRGDRHGGILDDRPTRIFRGVMQWVFGGSIGRILIISWTDIPVALCFIALAAPFVPRDVFQAILGPLWARVPRGRRGYSSDREDDLGGR